MARALQLEDFGAAARQADRAEAGEGVERESARLSAFEDGYAAGWDDAEAALGQSQQKIAADLAGNLADLSFTFHEARAHVLKGVEPLIRQLVATLLPEVARVALPALVSERLEAVLKQAAEAPVHIVAAPVSRARIEAVLPADPGFPLTLREEPTLAEGQVFIRTGDIEHAIDTEAALADLARAVDDFFELNNERLQAHG